MMTEDAVVVVGGTIAKGQSDAGMSKVSRLGIGSGLVTRNNHLSNEVGTVANRTLASLVYVECHS